MKILGGIVTAIGALLVIGSIGNDDFETRFPAEAAVGFAQNVEHALIGVAVLAIGALIMYLASNDRDSSRYY